ncbi:ATP-binding protein [Streptomyces meridianus]|uniref:histidine kinase n=1 Tax=Streptomyces meridianus TaxID=2938945 RepID=A0ABT0XDB3_9ACTN|nr:ATP-binding protein [Streptomyces meridianus]MCM2580501.1 ATP-binding protein [Streptomyces meridianus]
MKRPAGGRARAGTGRKVPVARRLGTAFGLVIFLIVFVGAGSLVTAWYEDRTVAELTQRVGPLRDSNVLLRTSLGETQRSLRNYLLLGDPAELRAYRRARSALPDAFREARRHDVPGTARNLDLQQHQVDAYLREAAPETAMRPGSPQALDLAGRLGTSFAVFRSTNEALDRRLLRDVDHLRNRTRSTVRVTAVATGALVAATVALALLEAMRTTHWLVRPLEQVRMTLARLTAGDHATRAPAVPPAEIDDVAGSVNALADETDRLRALEEERARLAAASRHAGRRIRTHLGADAVLREAAPAIGLGMRADHVLILLSGEDAGAVPVVQAWNAELGLVPEEELRLLPPLPPDAVPQPTGSGATFCIDDVRPYLAEELPVPGAPGSYGRTGMPAEVRAAVAELGGRAVAVSPFSPSREVDGCLILLRTRPDDVWGDVEIQTLESMATDVGRALLHSRLYEQEGRLVEELRALDRAKSEFLSTVSHELRTPLTSIAGYVELMLDEDTGELTRHQRKALDVVERNTVRLQMMIEDLLTLSRIESGEYKGVKQNMDVCGTVRAVTDAMRPVADDKGVELLSTCSHEPLTANADPHQLDRMLMNLMSNAVKFTPSGGRVTLRGTRRNGDVELTVRDTGIGIPEAEQKHLFTRFFRASNASGLAVPGTGLGLAIVRTIVDNHGGDLRIESREGEGTTVTVRLPSAGVG